MRGFDGRLSTFAHRVERLEVGHLKPVQRLVVFQAAENRQIDGVIVIRARRQCGAHDDLLRCNAAQSEGFAERQFVLGQGAGLVRAEHVHAGQLLDGHQPAHDGLFLREETRADRHRDRQHRGHCHGDRGHGEDQGELQRGEDRVAADDRDDGDHAHQQHSEDDQERADPQHRALEVADGLRFLHQFRRLAEVGVRTRGVHEGADLTLSNDRSGEHCVAGLARGGQRLPGERGLIHLDGISVQQTRICRNDVPKTEANDVARHQLTRWWHDPLAVPYRPSLDRELCLQGVDGLTSLVFFPESDHAVRNKQNKDDEEVRPMPQHARQDHRGFDHPGDRTPEVRKELQERIGLLLFDLIGSVLGQPLLRLDLAETVRRVAEPLFHLRQGKGLQIVLLIGLRSRLRVGNLGPGAIRSHDGYFAASRVTHAY